MLYDAVKVFEKKLNAEADCFRIEEGRDRFTDTELKTKFLVDHYIPKNGTYVLLKIDQNFQTGPMMEIHMDTKSGILIGETQLMYPYFRYLDYNSKLIEMNKPVAKKVVHSNQIYSFWVKKDSIAEGKLTEEAVDAYYSVLANPILKYGKSKKAMELYRKVEAETGEPDTCIIERIRDWVIHWLHNPETLPVDYSGKDYLKLFFVYDDERKTKELFEKENRRYLIPNIYNNNDYNWNTGKTILGPPSNNMGLNAKKPFLENKARKTAAPYLVSMDDAILQGRFFDYLWGCACKGNVNIYIDFDKNDIRALPDKGAILPAIGSGMYLRIRKGKEVEILDCDTVLDLGPNLKKKFCYKDILKSRDGSSEYQECRKRVEFAALIDEMGFGKQLAYNYFTPGIELSMKDNMQKNILLTYRDRLYTWLYKVPDCSMEQILAEMMGKLIRNSVEKGYWNRARQQLNLAMSLEDFFQENNQKEETMERIQEAFQKHMDMYQEEWDFMSDGEYFYAVGQMIGYFLSLSRALNKPYSMANPFLNAKEDSFIKEKLGQMFIRYDHAIDAVKDTRAKNIISHIMMFQPGGSVRQQDLIAGLTANNAFYKKKNGQGGNENDE